MALGLNLTLEWRPKEPEAGSHAIHLSLESDQFTLRHDEWTSAPDEINVAFAEIVNRALCGGSITGGIVKYD
jgi:hypothetical protein